MRGHKRRGTPLNSTISKTKTLLLLLAKASRRGWEDDDSGHIEGLPLEDTLALALIASYPPMKFIRRLTPTHPTFKTTGRCGGCGRP